MFKKYILMLVLLPTMLFAQTKSAELGALDWLSLIDSQNYEESWNRSGELFRSQISKDDWVAAVGAARESVGNLQSRQLLETKKLNNLPNMPGGEYIVIQYQSVFSGQQVTETLTLTKTMKEWRVIGYFIN
ncbi:DUF4019 domain-containing protein [Vibrio genomosp. F6]|uniref:DUF4019 domain-containing protein n=1 Tax=Vibrio genomosp. F6 str. FF-238 TaxID=1191298 RepID=A0A1E5D354_9VIBR|nr:DUF4019 domain-containing protein [Vibrio genomosp. F6]OEE77967.1 hypothetical protein A130_13970 [Vibrio genomosp. F6 str. FF-238]